MVAEKLETKDKKSPPVAFQLLLAAPFPSLRQAQGPDNFLGPRRGSGLFSSDHTHTLGPPWLHSSCWSYKLLPELPPTAPAPGPSAVTAMLGSPVASGALPASVHSPHLATALHFRQLGLVSFTPQGWEVKLETQAAKGGSAFRGKPASFLFLSLAPRVCISAA